MNRSKNHYISKKRFFFTDSGKKNKQNFFLLPTIFFSLARHLSWDMVAWGIVFAWGSYYYQINFCIITKNLNTTLYKQDVAQLVSILKTEGLFVHDVQAMLDFLNRNPQLIILFKNADLEHYYVKQIIKTLFNNTNFVSYESDNPPTSRKITDVVTKFL